MRGPSALWRQRRRRRRETYSWAGGTGCTHLVLQNSLKAGVRSLRPAVALVRQQHRAASSKTRAACMVRGCVVEVQEAR